MDVNLEKLEYQKREFRISIRVFSNSILKTTCCWELELETSYFT